VTDSDPRDHRTPGLLAWAAVVLSFAAGATDAFAFLLLGGVFTANMTGNLVLAGLTERPDYAATVVGITVAIIAFAVGLLVSFRIARAAGPPSRLVTVLVLGTLAQLGVLIGWLSIPSVSTMWAQAPLIALSAFAMASQTAVSKRAESRSGVSTTYVTGTITSLIADFSDGRPQDGLTRVAVIGALVAGALCGSLAISLDADLGAAMPIPPAVLGTVLIWLGYRVARRRQAAPQA